ncbi:sensor histidine kinase [Streptomyces sp. NPDC058623]|uniref:sensor histidine kinase n=1 Tax=Streptomyces sp. NPDC058623 TaxID=3346563 RepID=UPI00364BBE55
MNGIWQTRWPWWAEAALVASVTFLTVQEAAVSTGGRYVALPVAAALVGSAATALRRSLPVPATVVVVGVAGVWGMIEPLLVVIFHLATRERLRLALAAGVVALAVNHLVGPVLSLWAPRSFGPTVLLALAVSLGAWAGSRRRLVDALAVQVQQLRAERDLRERTVRLAERNAIAAEMHDVLAHRLSLIALHAGVLNVSSGTLPTPVAERLSLLRTTATDALGDLRDILGALRHHGTADVRDPATLLPALQDLDQLIESAREAGQEVELSVSGGQRSAPAAHRLAVYRIVREALTNARRHAAGAGVAIVVDYDPPATRVEVTNTAGTPSPNLIRSGYGLIGLRERVESLGGHLSAGPAGAGSWRIAARIPHSNSQNGPVS